MPLRLASLVVFAVLALAAPAAASVSLTNLQLQPSTTQAGAHPDVTIGTSFTESPSSDDVKSLSTVLPQGLIGDPNAADRCTQQQFSADTCPASSKVGSTTAAVTVIVVPGILEVPQNVAGDVYDLRPTGGEPARLGIVLRPSVVNGVNLPKVFLQSPATIGPQTNYGIATTFDNLPRSSGPFDIRLTGMTLKLNGAAAHGSFMTNPTDCRAATMSANATAYDTPGSSSRTASFTPTACDRLPFAPAFGGSVGGAGQTAQGASPTLTTVIASDPGQANMRQVTVTLPGSVGPNVAAIGRACSSDQFASGTCPPSAVVGQASASSPLLSAPATGPVVLVTPPGGGLPQLTVALGGPVPITLTGQVTLANGVVSTTFDDVPDLPVSAFVLTINGGPGGLLTNTEDLCAAGAKTTASAALLAHSGASAAPTAQLAVPGCGPGRPGSTAAQAAGRARVKLKLRFKHGRATLTGRLLPPPAAARLTRARLTLPTTLRGKRGGVHVNAGGKRVSRRALRVHGRTLDVRLTANGAESLKLRWTGLRPTVSLARKLRKHPRLTFVTRVTDLLRTTTTVRTKLRAH